MIEAIRIAAYPVLRAIESGDLTPKEFARRARRLSRSLDNFEAERTRAVKVQLRRLDQEIRDRLSEFSSTEDLQRANVDRIIDDAVNDFTQRRRTVIQSGTQKAIDLASEFRQKLARSVRQPVTSAPISGKIAEDLITIQGVRNEAFGDTLRRKLKGEVSRLAGEGKTPRQIAQEIVAKRIVTPLRQRDDPVAHGALGQANGLTQSDIRQTFNAASHVQSNAENRSRGGGVRKSWVDQDDGLVRTSHDTAGKRYAIGGKPGPIPVRERYQVGADRLRFPQDPSGTLKEIAGCRCFSVELIPDVLQLVA